MTNGWFHIGYKETNSSKLKKETCNAANKSLKAYSKFNSYSNYYLAHDILVHFVLGIFIFGIIFYS
jgi:hypothetical protein